MEWGQKRTFRIYFLHLVIALGPKTHLTEHRMSSFSFIQVYSMALNLKKGML